MDVYNENLNSFMTISEGNIKDLYYTTKYVGICCGQPWMMIPSYLWDSQGGPIEYMDPVFMFAPG